MTMGNTTPKHTPGPWTMHESVQTGEFFVTAGEQDCTFICRTTRRDEASRYEATLIAAAPCLLAACEAFLSGQNQTEARRLARAAIAKAKGE
jgi:hypothetical protein